MPRLGVLGGSEGRVESSRQSFEASAVCCFIAVENKIGKGQVNLLWSRNLNLLCLNPGTMLLLPSSSFSFFSFSPFSLWLAYLANVPPPSYISAPLSVLFSVCLFVFFCFFLESGAHYLDQATPEFTEIYLLLSPRAKGVCHYAQPECLLTVTYQVLKCFLSRKQRGQRVRMHGSCSLLFLSFLVFEGFRGVVDWLVLSTRQLFITVASTR